MFQLDFTRMVAASISPAGFAPMQDFFNHTIMRATGAMAFLMIGLGITMVGHMWRLVFRSGGVMDVSSEMISRQPQDRAQRKMQRELDQGK